LNIRGFLFEIMQRRSDLSGRDRLGMAAIQGAVRKVCKETLLLKSLVALASATFTPGLNGEAFYRPSTTTPALPVPLALDPGAEPVACEVVRYTAISIPGTDNTKLWINERTKDQLKGYAKEQGRYTGAPAATAQSTFQWADGLGTLLLYPALPVAMQTIYPTINAEVAMCPTHDNFETIDLPAEAEDAIIQLALAKAYEIAGTGQNPSLALSHEAKGLTLCAGLRALDKMGTSGDTNRGHESPFSFSLRG